MQPRDGRGDTHDLTGVVDVARAAPVTAHGSKLRHHSVVPEEGVGCARGGLGAADDLATGVDSACLASVPAQCSQLLHRTVLPQEGAFIPAKLRPTDDLPRIVDVPGGSFRIDPGDGTVLPHGGINEAFAI